MPIATATSGGNVPVDFEDGRCILTLVKVTDTDLAGNLLSGQFGPQWQWQWTWKSAATGEPFHNDRGFIADFWERTSQRMGKGGAQTAEARIRVEALLGREMEAGEDIDTDDLEGRSIVAMMIVNDRGWVEIVKGSIKPYTPKAKAAAKAAPVATEDEDEDE